MATSESKSTASATRAKNKYRDKAYDQINVVAPKGKKAEYQAHAGGRGESLSRFIGRAADETMERDKAVAAFTVKSTSGEADA